MKYSKRKRWLSLVLCLCLSLPTILVRGEEADTTGLCPHHPEHTEDCGYMEGEQPCGYVCEECVALEEEPEEELEEEPEEEPGEEQEEEPEEEPGEEQEEEPEEKLEEEPKAEQEEEPEEEPKAEQEEEPEAEPAPEEALEEQEPAPISDAGELTEETAAVKVVKDGTTTYYASFDDLVATSFSGTEDITILKDTALNKACNEFGCKSLTVNADATLTLNADLSFIANALSNAPISGGGAIAGTGTLTVAGEVSSLTISCPLKALAGTLIVVSSGTFSNCVTISGDISKITGGTFSGTVNVESGATIEGGTFNGIVNNTVGYIKGGSFTGTVNNTGEIYSGTFSGTVNNNVGTIIGGTFSGSVENKSGIDGGTFDYTVKNYEDGYISGGTFHGQIINYGEVFPTDTSSITLGDDFSIINYGEVYCTEEHFKNTSGICRLCGDGCTHASWEDGICETCGTVCKHENYEDGKCTVCGSPCPHTSYEDGKCTLCGSYQPPEQKDGVYQIGNAEELLWFAQQVNSGNTKINAVLTANIDLSGIDWTPIGLYTDDPATNANNASYAGTFDGQYHVIFNLSVNMSTTNYEAGLFSRVVSGGKLMNFGIVNATINQNSDGHEGKGVRAGVVAGEIFSGNVTNVFTAGTLNVSTKHEQRGGIAGECASSTLTNCYTTYERLTTVVSVTSYVPTITNCYYMANEADASSYGTNVSEDKFASGELTYTLNGGSSQGVWKQTLGTDTYPKFSGGTVYSVNGQYTNTESVARVEISWGTMEFTYTDGGWNTETHTYDEGGWTASGNTVTVTNTGTEAVKVMASYENAAGYTFAADWSRKTAEVPGGTAYTFTMNLSGKPASALNNATIGTITVALTDADTMIGWVVKPGNIDYYENGSPITEGTRTIDGVEYSFIVTGLILKGKTKLDGKWYCPNVMGLLVQGWVSATENGTTVYYYAKEDYSLAVNEPLEIGGVTYTFDANCRSDKAPSQ